MVQSILSKCGTFIFLNAIFICLAYLFTLQECLKSPFLSSLRVKYHTIHTCLNLILYISILVLYAYHFWLDEIVLKLSGDTEENTGPNLALTKVSLFVIGI